MTASAVPHPGDPGRPGAPPASPQERLAFGHGTFTPVPGRPAEAPASEPASPAAFTLTQPDTWDWGWGGLLFFSILLFFRPQDQIAGIARLHLSDLSAMLGLAGMIFFNISRGRAVTRMTPELLAVFALGAVILFTVPFSIWPGGSLHVFIDIFIKVALIYVLMVNTINSPRRIEHLCWVIVLAFGYISIRAWADYARGINLVEGGRVSGAAGGFFENPNDLALNLATFLPFALMFVQRPGPAFRRIASAVLVVFMLGAIVFTKSRSGMLGTVAMLVVYLFTTRSLKPTVILAGVVTAMLVLPMIPSSFWERMASITDEEKDETGSREQRSQLMLHAWQTFLERPITGVGADQFQNYALPGEANMWRVTHNAYLQVAAELGIFGVAAFLFLVWRGFSAAWWTRRELNWIYRRRSRRKPQADPEDGLTAQDRYFLQTHAAAMLACMTGWFVCAIFASVALNWTIYYLVGLSAAGRDIVLARGRAVAAARKAAAAGHPVIAA